MPFQDPTPASKLGSAMLHMSVEQLCLPTQHPSFGPAIERLLELFHRQDKDTTKETAIAAFIASIEGTAHSVCKSDLQKVFVMLNGPVRAEPDEGPINNVAASPSFIVQAAAVKPNESFVTKHIVGMPTVEGKIPSGIKAPLWSLALPLTLVPV